jgi:RimJ/RimL family protein N-acetyltransferase
LVSHVVFAALVASKGWQIVNLHRGRVGYRGARDRELMIHVNLSTKALSIRPATMDDAEMLFQWRNDELTRSMVRNPDLVAWDGHIDWLTRRLAMDPAHLYIALHELTAIGTFRVDGDEISYTVAPQHRNRGNGFLMLSCARKIFGPLRADIFARNRPSIRIASRAGFRVNIMAD